MSREPRGKRNQRRLIGIAPRKMLAASHVVKLIAKKTVMPNAGEMQKKLRRSKSREDGRGAGRRHPKAGGSNAWHAKLGNLQIAHWGFRRREEKNGSMVNSFVR